MSSGCGFATSNPEGSHDHHAARRSTAGGRRGNRILFLSVKVEEDGSSFNRTYGYAHIGPKGAISRRTKKCLFNYWSSEGRTW